MNHQLQIHGETIKTSGAIIPNSTAIAAAEICVALGNAHPTAAQIESMSRVMTTEMMFIGLDGVLLHESAAMVNHLIVEATIYGPDSAYMTAPAPMPTEAQAEATVALLGQPGGLFSIFGF